MTREQALKILKSMSDISTQGEAIDMAIEALEMQNNCIICPRCGKGFSEYEGRKQTNDK